ncbi:unnamed protein product [Paramecium primaurelia]|uniref:Zinc finger PHD-type domain-containing protein n=1 Tax=Paramecium primaurelia TaxID=5886 RepID=A0A8S1Q0M2_PARPR|nr:unnamed protein product [Paramecium primaurelia]
MIEIKINSQWAAFIKGHIYYRAKDVQKFKQDFPKLNECASKDLFLTDQTEWFLSTTFLQKIQVKPIDEYNIVTIELNDVYYKRAEYNTLEQKFNPPISEWIKYCFCKKLYNPREHYIQCNQCNLWVHYSCSDRSDKEFKIISELKFICFQCVEENKNNKLNLSDNENKDGQPNKLNTNIQVNKKK